MATEANTASSVIVVTNNELVHEAFSICCQVFFIADGYLEVLLKTRDLIHKGHRLLTHPLAGSVKPGETPYRTILLTGEREELETMSLQLIEDAIVISRRMIEQGRFNCRMLSDQHKKDFQLIDYTVVESAWASVKTGTIR
jgi:hypothetical protein